MKRSRMLNKISQEFVHFLINKKHVNVWNVDQIDKLSEVILKTIETLGMLPPIESGRTVSDLDLGAPEWESEDD